MNFMDELNAYWVKEERFMAGAHPARGRIKDSVFRGLLREGLTHYFDLTSGDEALSYEAEVSELAVEMKMTAHYHHFPIRDFSAPTEDYLIGILDEIDKALDAGEGVYVHCYAGIGRTGTVVGAWLVRHGLSPRKVLKAIAYLRGDGIESPESLSQVDLITNWEPGL